MVDETEFSNNVDISAVNKSPCADENSNVSWIFTFIDKIRNK